MKCASQEALPNPPNGFELSGPATPLTTSWGAEAASAPASCQPAFGLGVVSQSNFENAAFVLLSNSIYYDRTEFHLP